MTIDSPPRQKPIEIDSAPLPLAVRLADLAELTKPRITMMVVLTTAIGFVLASRDSPFALTSFLAALCGTGLLAAGASALNMVLERDADARMARTAARPLPAGRLEPEPAVVFSLALMVSGLLALALLVNAMTALLGAFTAVAYLFAYTPLKRVTPLATLVGAVPGAVPPLMGWSASQGRLELGAWVLFGILFFWQLPHFFAIGWLHRADYERGGFPLLPVVDREGKGTAVQTVLFTIALVLTSLAATPLGLAGTVYGIAALLLGALFLARASTFARQRSESAARSLMLYSIVYLPVLLTVLVIDRGP